MKILWFSPIPIKDNSVVYGGGWVSSLEKLINEHTRIKLGVAFHSNTFNRMELVGNNTIYFPIKTHSYSIRGRIFNKVDFTYLLNEYLRIIDDFNPDVIHIFGTEHAFSNIIFHTNIPILVHLQGLVWPIYINWYPKNIKFLKVFLFSSFKKYLLGSGIIRAYYKFKEQAKREIRIIKNVRHFAGRTNWDKAYISVINPIANYYHIDEVLRDEFYKYEWNFPKSNKISLLTTIGPNLYKGFDTIIQVAYTLKHEKKIDFIWHIVGIDGNEEVVYIFEKIFKCKFYDLNVKFLGKKKPNEIINLMLKSTYFIHPSHIDNSPNSVCEAMMIGVPVISANVGGVSSLIKDGCNGFLYSDYNIEQILEHIINNYDENSLRNISKNARQTAMKRHSKDKILKDTVEIYNLLNNSNGY